MPGDAVPLTPNKLKPAEILALFEPIPQQVEQSASFTFGSHHIRQNREYEKRIRSTTFRFDAGDDSVNAYATDSPWKLTSGETVPPPSIIFLGGLARALRVAAAALAVHHEMGTADVVGSGLTETFQRIGAAVRKRGTFEADAGRAILIKVIVPRLVELENRVLATARNFCFAMESFVIAHEAGHIAYCHPLGPSLNLDISRNQERDADSFASSVMSSNPYQGYHFLGAVAVTMVFCWFQSVKQKPEAGTHPLARERFERLFDASGPAAEAARLGLTRQVFETMLPAA